MSLFSDLIKKIEVPNQNLGDLTDGPTFQLMSWSSSGNAYVFVTDNNIYYRPSVHFKGLYPLTTSGVPGIIFNGIPDWIYEEEIMSSNRALWFSPDGNKLAYAQFNDSLVDEVVLPDYQQQSQQYLQTKRFRYPKAGSVNPTVKLFVVDLNNLENLQTYYVTPPIIISQK